MPGKVGTQLLAVARVGAWLTPLSFGHASSHVRCVGCTACRSRDKGTLDHCDVIIDVGGVYEPDNNRFDHHQRGFGEVFGHGFNTKLSSAGEQWLSSSHAGAAKSLQPGSCLPLLGG
eukprot:GHRQ01026162.1.p2 GENE.GHRQ01026162.1~~GHRQ01026162.1.p2  ORF type:complete len:117 (-),score=38.53 GHRQ01026162.1:159-509(-)